MSCAIFTPASLTDMLADVLADPATLRLYVGVASDQPTADDFEEPNGGGYAGKPMKGPAWDLSNAPQLAVYPKQTWTFTGPAGLVMGFFITRNSDGHLRWYEPLVDEMGNPAPMRIVNDGDQISVTPRFTFAAAAEDDDDPDADDALDVAGKTEQPS